MFKRWHITTITDNKPLAPQAKETHALAQNRLSQESDPSAPNIPQ